MICPFRAVGFPRYFPGASFEREAHEEFLKQQPDPEVAYSSTSVYFCQALKVASDYRRLFQARDVPFLASCVFVDGYAPLQVLVTYETPTWTSYMPRAVEQQTLADGRLLYSTPGTFQRLQEDFYAYRERSRTFFEAVLRQPPITTDQVATFFSYASEIFSYYSKTEFFYTDELFRQSASNETIAQNIRELGPFKLAARACMNTFFLADNNYRKRLARLIGGQFGLTADDVEQYAPKEIVQLYDGVRVSPEIVHERASQYVSYGDGTAVVHLRGDEAARIIASFVSPSNTSATLVRGTCANPGTAIGRARIFHLELAEPQRVQERARAMARGEVLVAETTGPEIMEACQKASAIVTNQGGMLSHAAIVSRELGIPCIIGTGNATELLKDGDSVAVDAEKGVVRILERADNRKRSPTW